MSNLNQVSASTTVIPKYKVKNPLNPFLSYRYKGEEVARMKAKSIEGICEGALPSAHELILNWNEFIKEEMEGEYADYANIITPCWAGHYEQFGRVMYHLINVSSNKSSFIADKRFSKEELALFPKGIQLDYIAQGADGTEDRIFYRTWLSLIQHPEFQNVGIDSFESVGIAYWQYVFTLLIADLGLAMRNKSNSKILHLHLAN